jgi:hypothetical protein
MVSVCACVEPITSPSTSAIADAILAPRTVFEIATRCRLVIDRPLVRTGLIVGTKQQRKIARRQRGAMPMAGQGGAGAWIL